MTGQINIKNSKIGVMRDNIWNPAVSDEMRLYLRTKNWYLDKKTPLDTPLHVRDFKQLIDLITGYPEFLKKRRK